MRVAVLGGGPSAAYTYRACADHGLAPDVYAEKLVRTAIPGAFWFYWLPETAGLVPEKITVSFIGTAETYSAKAWSESLPSSFPDSEHTVRGYEPSASLFALWDGLETYHRQRFASDEEISSLAKKYDIVFQTFPTFESLESQPPPKQVALCARTTHIAENTVLYNGSAGNWLRMSFLFGKFSYECVECLDMCPIRHQPRLRQSTAKKLHPKTEPWTKAPAENVHLVGRFAAWKRKMLAHNCYLQAKDILEGRSWKT